jgi:hypothetical protein
MDARVKPAHDEVEALTRRALSCHVAAREMC